MILINKESDCVINNDFIEYTIQEIESVFNKNYCINHKSVIIVIEPGHCINISEVTSIYQIEKYFLIGKDDLLKFEANETCLVIKIRKILLNEMTSKYIHEKFPFLISFYTTSFFETSLIGTMYPIIDIQNNKINYLTPASITISEFD